MAAAELLPLLKERVAAVHAPVGKASYVRVFLCFIALAVAAATTARSFPRGVAERASEETELRGSQAIEVIRCKDKVGGATLAPGATYVDVFFSVDRNTQQYATSAVTD